MTAYVLDSYALLAYFNSEPGGSLVTQLLEAGRDLQAELYMSYINLGELYYIALRRVGRANAQAMLVNLHNLPVKMCEVSEIRILAAAELKAVKPISYADAFAAALAKELGALLVTGDPEFKILEPDLSVFWLP